MKTRNRNDRDTTVQLELDFNLPPKSVKFLGDYGVVAGLMQDLTKRSLVAYDNLFRGEVEPEPSQAIIEGLVQEYADIFLGKNPEYQPAEWQSPYSMGIRLLFSIDTPYSEPPFESYFAFLMGQCQGAALDLASGVSEKEVMGKLAPIVKQMTDKLSGVER